MPVDSRFLELCRRRYSVKRFSSRPVERQKLRLCLEAARLAPSAENAQPWRFVVFDDPDEKDAVANAVFRGVYSHTRPLARAPVLVALLLKQSIVVNQLGGKVQGTPFQVVDAGIAGEHFVLAATEQGLGTCWIGWFDSRALLRHLKLSRRAFRAVCLIAVGYPAGDLKPRERNRRPLEDIVCWNRPPETPP
ncbi:MAG: nitroreductase family protein [candidate division WOR-3 bacterium]|nr:MAG: nitroreductase family protein [candidate division WOR-3 bacterium]